MDRIGQVRGAGSSLLPPPALETPQERLDRFTPGCLTASQWQAAEPAVRVLVIGCSPVNAEDAKGLVSRLCLLLAAATGPAPVGAALPAWDGTAAPDLRVLLSEASISAQLERLRAAGKSSKTRENHRADLRRLARATQGLPPRAARTQRPPAAGSARVSASALPLLTWLSEGEAPLTALAAHRTRTGRAITRGLLTPLLSALPTWPLAASGAAADPSIIGRLIAASDPRLDEVSAATWAADSSDLNDRPDLQDRPTSSAADSASTAARARPTASSGPSAAPSASGSSTSRTAQLRAARKALTAAVAAAPLPPLDLPDDLTPAERKRRILVHKREHALAVAAALEAQVQADADVAMAAAPGPSSAEAPLHADLLVEPDLDGLSSSAREGVQAYKPDERLSAEQWSLLAPLTRRLIAAYRPDTEAIARKTGSLVAPFCLWALQHQLSATTPVVPVARVVQLRASELVEPALLDLYVETLEGADASIAKTRSVLRRCLRGLDPTLTPRVIAYQPVAAPYSARECAALVRLCRNQPTATKRRQLSIVLALALGAGLDGRDLRAVRASDITEHTLPDGRAVLLVQVTGDRPRIVVVRAQYEPLLREALAAHLQARRGRDALLLGKDVDRRNVTGPALDRAVTATGFDVDVSVNRLRSTWLVACLTAGVPLPALLPAAGLRSARTITDLLAYCPPPPAEQVTALLAGAADVALATQAAQATARRGPRTSGGAR